MWNSGQCPAVGQLQQALSVPGVEDTWGPRTCRRPCCGQERRARGNVRPCAQCLHMAGAQRVTGRRPRAALRLRGVSACHAGPASRGSETGRRGPATKKKGPGARGRSGPRVSASEKGPSRHPLPLRSALPPAPHIRRRVCKGLCGAPEKTPLSLRGLTTALPNIGDLFCLSLHI